jgi:hypothetical protein
LDAARLVERHADRVEFTTMNTGCAVPGPFPRGLNTFVPLQEFEHPGETTAARPDNALVTILEP